jgi:site-specific recombinase XerD
MFARATIPIDSLLAGYEAALTGMRHSTCCHAKKKLKKISFEKPVNSHIVEFMSMEIVSTIVERTDARTAKGLRDRVFIILLYDTGARVQEMLDIRLCNLHLATLAVR